MSDLYDWVDQVNGYRNAELMVAFDRILEAGWDERHLYMRYGPVPRGKSGQVSSVMLRACALWTSDIEVFRVTWQFDETDNAIVVTPMWLRPVPEFPVSMLTPLT